MRIKMDNSSSLPILVWTAIILIIHVSTCNAWNNEEMEMYDLVEEVGKNFYEVIGVAQDASDKEIRTAYRKNSIKLHPDKNPAEDAATKFRQLVGIYEVLKNKELRESYNKVLVEGLPNWKQPMFYFRRARKFAVWQVCVILLVIVSVTQYAASWGSYFERRLSMKEMVDARLRKTHRTKKGQKEGPTAEELEAEFEKYLPKPSVFNTAPFQICRGIKYLIFTFPKDLLEYREELRLQKEEEAEQLAIEAERLEQERLKAEEPKKPRKRKTFKVPEKGEQENDETQPIWNVDESAAVQQQAQQKSSKKPVISGGLWTDDDIAELSKLCSKFPGGTPNRWETISEILNRPVPEVTFMAKKVLEKLANKAVEEEQESQAQVKVKVKTKGGKADSITSGDNRTVENWSAEEQKQLEYALQVYPKGSIERWEKIAHMVPNRSKEECMQRFKYVADLVKKKKEAKSEPELESLENKLDDNLQSEPKVVVVVEEKKKESQPLEILQSSSINPDPAQSTSAPTIPETTPVQVPDIQSATTTVGTSSSGSGNNNSSKSKKKPKSKTTSATINKNLGTENPQKEKNEEVKKPLIVPDSKPEVKKVVASPSPPPPASSSASVCPPAKLVESEIIDSVESQLQMLVDESVSETSKARLRRSSSSKSSTEDDALIDFVRASKECSVEKERKNSISSNNSDNEWCVVEETGVVTISSINTH